MLTKHNVCLFIKDEEHLEEMRDFLKDNKEYTGQFFWISSELDNYLIYHKTFKWGLFRKTNQTEVKTEQFKKLWKTRQQKKY